jgi:site-specific DNA recombinase
VRYKTDVVETSFEKELARWKPHMAVQQLYRLLLQDMYEREQGLRRKELLQIKKKSSGKTNASWRPVELRLSNDLDTDDYRAIKMECEQRIASCEGRLIELSAGQQDIGPMMADAIAVLSNLDEHYRNGSTELKRELIGSIFPEKLIFTGDMYRTTNINEAVRLIYSMGAAFGEIKMGQGTHL